MIGLALFVALLSPAAASLVVRHNATGLEKPASKHRLRVCNAYPSAHALRVLKNSEEFMGQSQMKYKECTELKGPLNEGDRLNFQADDSIPLSTFTVNDLPKEQSTLLLVAYRESKDSAKIAFKSHIFTVSREAQLAVIDTFQGETKAKLSISEFRCNRNRHSTGSTPALQIPMKFSTVMALESGIYEVKITSGASTHSVGPFNVADGEHYVVLRTGLDDVESVSRHAKSSAQSFLLNVAPIDQPPSFLQEKSGQDTGAGGEIFGDSLSLLATHGAMDGQKAPLEGEGTEGPFLRMPERERMLESTAGHGFLQGLRAESDDVQLMAMHAGKSEKEELFSVDLSAEHKTEEGAGTGGPGFAWEINPEVPKSHRHTKTDHGESIEQFLGLARIGSYPQEFVIHPLLKPAQNPCPAAEDERSGATAAGSLTALAVAILATALL